MDRCVFGRRFKLSTGMTPHDYVVRCRLRRAMKLLSRTDRSIVDIALDVGCACQSHFTTMFARAPAPRRARFVARDGEQLDGDTRRSLRHAVRNARPPRFAMGTVANVAANQA